MGKIAAPVFLSYADEDANIARRIYLALQESEALEIWGYKENGRIGVDFIQELRAKIGESRYFCLLDSPNARRSAWIREECALARAGPAIMAICMITPEGSWRADELFPGQNNIRAIDFSDFDLAIQKLCEYLQVRYSSRLTLPRDRDFTKEIFRPGLNSDRAAEIYGLYREFRERAADTEFGEAQLRVIIRKCEYYGARHVVSPSLALGIMHGNAGRHVEAAAVFSTIVALHPRDPRGWAALGGAQYYLGQYRESLGTLRQAVNAAVTWYVEDSAERMPELMHNIASVQLALGSIDDADDTLSRLRSADQDHPYIHALKGRILLHRSDCTSALPLLLRAYRKPAELSPAVLIDLADCYLALTRTEDEARVMREGIKLFDASPELFRRAADCFLHSRQTLEAIDAMRTAAQLTRASPMYRAQLAALLCRTGANDRGTAEALECTALAAPTSADRYYRGLAWWVLGETAVAEVELALSRENRIVSQWPHYAAVCRAVGRVDRSTRQPVR